jgi:hypothetical protein
MKDEGKGSAGVSPVVFGVPPNTSPPGAHSTHQHVNDLLWKTERGVRRETPRTTTGTVALPNQFDAAPSQSQSK